MWWRNVSPIVVVNNGLEVCVLVHVVYVVPVYGAFRRCLFWCIAACSCACGIASCKSQASQESCHLPLRFYTDKSKAHATVTKRLFVAAIFIHNNA